ncbi:ground-like domain-containing protein [Ditylenchus destructor]|uniref:Ground-like domain-containing protein n=1 Tax=Ditylenchus destructor TaxID=166010 RepID=A0AAD4N7L8_9BILA|nr:ground-like domain-containing protein [Ditylenchus destructor]
MTSIIHKFQQALLILGVLLALSQFAYGQEGNENCYINDSGFTCCSKMLENAMKSAMTGRDLLSSADTIQKMAEGSLGGKFETVVAMDDFAYKSHFKDGKTCKVEKDGQYALAWQP